MKQEIKNKFWIVNGWGMIFLFLLLMGTLGFRDAAFLGFVNVNYVIIHLIIEFFIISASFTIAIQAWLTFRHTLSRQRIWLGAIFASVGLIEIFHAITYKGMPYFLMESSPYQATWFYMAARLVLALGLLFTLTMKDKAVAVSYRWTVYGLAIVHAVSWIIIVFYPIKLLPELVLDGAGPTVLKNGLQYGAIGIQTLCILYLLKRLTVEKSRNLLLIAASCCLIIGDFLFTSYQYVDDLNNFMGHLFQLAGFYFILRAIYHTSVEEPFQLLQESKQQLTKSEGYLQAMASQIGEGIIVIDKKQRITFSNPMAEKLLSWRQSELKGKDFQQFIQADAGNCPCTTESEKEGESHFTRKDGSGFPVSYVTTPFKENGQTTGSIIVFRDITEQKKREKRITYLAYYDEMTKLPNYRYFTEYIKEAIDTKPKIGKVFLMLDIDRFETISESLGHRIARKVLAAVAHRLRRELPSEVLLGNLRGKEFTVFLEAFSNEEVEKLCRQIEKILIEPFVVQQFQLNISMHMGIALYPQHGENEIDLLKNAQVAMYEAQKEALSYKFFAPAIHDQRLELLILENDLYKAIENNELYLEYQPQIDLKLGKIHAVEALVRWQHPKRGIVSPGQFISIAEETGLIVPIGEWVLKTACQQLKCWHDQGLPKFKMAVNISTRQFYQHNLVDVIKGILQDTALSPRYLELEITESMTMNINNAKEVLLALKRLGVSIAMDDFGTGYSSLNYLNQFPIDRLKIDRSFIKNVKENEHHSALSAMIISIAKHLGINVTAEGIETFEQLDFLWTHNCFQIQGYLFSKPISPDQLLVKFEEIQQQALMYSETIGKMAIRD